MSCSGCGSTPYATVALSYQIDANTDYWLRTTRDEQCSKQPKFDGEVGLEFNNNWTMGYHHQSWLLCGGPFNSNPEIFADDIRVTKKFGGK